MKEGGGGGGGEGRKRLQTNPLILKTYGYQQMEGLIGLASPTIIFLIFGLLLSNCLNWKIYCDDHSSLSSTTAVQNELFHYFTSILTCVNQRFVSN